MEPHSFFLASALVVFFLVAADHRQDALGRVEILRNDVGHLDVCLLYTSALDGKANVCWMDLPMLSLLAMGIILL